MTKNRIVLPALIFLGFSSVYLASGPYSIDELWYLHLTWNIKNLDWVSLVDYMYPDRVLLIPLLLSQPMSVLGEVLVHYRIAILLAATLLGFWVFSRLLRNFTTLPLYIFAILGPCNPHLAFCTSQIRADSAVLLFQLISFLLLLYAIENSERRSLFFIGAGFFYSFGMMGKLPLTALTLPFLVFWIYLKDRRGSLLFMAASVFTVLLPIGYALYRIPIKTLLMLIPYGTTNAALFIDLMGSRFAPLPQGYGLFALVFWIPALGLLLLRDKIKWQWTDPVAIMALGSLASVLLMKPIYFIHDFALAGFWATLLLSVGIGALWRSGAMPLKILATAVFVTVLAFGIRTTLGLHRMEIHYQVNNPFIHYEDYFKAGKGMPITFSTFAKSRSRTLCTTSPFDHMHSRAQQDLVVRRFGEFATKNDLCGSSFNSNVFRRSSPVWESMLPDYNTFGYNKSVKILNKATSGLENKRDLELLSRIMVHRRIRYDPETDSYSMPYFDLLRNDPPIAIKMDNYIFWLVEQDDRISMFLDQSYRIFFDPETDSFFAIHKLLGRKLLTRWNQGVFLNESTGLIMEWENGNFGNPPESWSERELIRLHDKTDHPEAMFLLGFYYYHSGQPEKSLAYIDPYRKRVGFKDLEADAIFYAIVKDYSKLQGLSDFMRSNEYHLLDHQVRDPVRLTQYLVPANYHAGS